jgi:hypothetical protein
MSAENTTIAKFIESILFEEYKKADGFLNQIVESKMKEKIKCSCEDEKTAPFKKKKGGKKKKGDENKSDKKKSGKNTDFFMKKKEK